MGRIGISYLEVANTASALQGKNINPTVDAVREVLGTGSRSTIGPYLKQWRDKQEVSGNTLGLPPELSSLVKGLYERLQAEADHRIEEEIQRCEAQISAVQQSIVLVQTEKDALINETHVLCKKLEEALQSVQALGSTLADEQKQGTELKVKVREQEQRLNDRDTHIQFLENQLRNVQNNLEHYRESMKAQREEEKRAHEREINLLTQESTSLKQQTGSLNLINKELNQKLEATQAEMEEFKREWYEQKGRIMEFQEQIKLKDWMIGELEEKYNGMSESYQQAQSAMQAEKNQALQREKDIAILGERLNSALKSSKETDTVVEKLQSERIFLAQENGLLKTELRKLGEAFVVKEKA